MDDQDRGTLSPWGECETLEGGALPRWGEWETLEGGRIFLLAGDAPLPEGVEEGDEGVFVIRLVAPTREDVEAARAAN